MSRTRFTAILAMAAALSTTITGCGTESSAPETTPANQEQESGKPVVNITDPKEDTKVPQKQKVTGTAAGVPEDKELWIFTVTKTKRGKILAPQSTVIEVGDDGKWTQTAYVGTDDGSDSGAKFKISVFLVPTSEGDAIAGYLKGAEETGKYPGFDPPDGSTEVASVAVVKK